MWRLFKASLVVMGLALVGCTDAVDPSPPSPEPSIPSVPWVPQLDELESTVGNVCDSAETIERRGWRVCEAASSKFLDDAMDLAYAAEADITEGPNGNTGSTVTGLAINQVACMNEPTTEDEAAQCLGQGEVIVATGRLFIVYMRAIAASKG